MNQPLTIALRLARHPVNDLERLQLGAEIIPSLQPGENVDTGALRILADRVEWLETQAEECRVALKDVAAGRSESRVRHERDALRAENGRQAATIAELLYAEVKPAPVRFETTHTGRCFRQHFRDWMEGDSPQSHPNAIDPASPHP